MAEALFRGLAGSTALAIECAAVLIIAYGALEALFHLARHMLRGNTPAGWRKSIFVRLGIWLLLGLQFALAADIVRSVISPTWYDIGQLAAIAAIRTALNYFLERDIAGVSAAGQADVAKTAS